MSVYQVKLLELTAIKKKDEKCFLHIRVSFEQDMELYWEIDEYTAKNLMDITNFGGSYRYRISFNTLWNGTKKQHIGILIQTYREQSELISFPCSEDYIKKLNSIKALQDINDLDKLGFLSADPLSSDEGLKGTEQEEPIAAVSPRKYYFTSTRTTAAFFSILFIVLFSCSSQGYLIGKVDPDKNIIAQTTFLETAIDQSYDADVVIKADVVKDDIVAKDLLTENLLPKQSMVPFVELGETVSYSIPKGHVALTFDDGPSKYSTEIMDILKKYGIGGTFFFIGLNVKKYPEHVQYIHSNGYSIGTHSMNHSNLPALSNERQEEELIQSGQLIENLTGEKLSLFRPPYGAMNQRIIELANKHEYKIILWNNDPEDWRNKNADAIVNHIKNTKVSGSIILLHESQAVIDALPRIIEYLQEQNLEIVSLK
ncbi:polysaccharide deacetylase family protein [Defluviitalea saccharophila]|uniref:Polysaccharide deacetylase family protein n=1 Tax=Defluviitalea saccharophila TaxID=879970 RepID=A0ABZ2Y5J5_9FIRM